MGTATKMWSVRHCFDAPPNGECSKKLPSAPGRTRHTLGNAANSVLWPPLLNPVPMQVPSAWPLLTSCVGASSHASSERLLRSRPRRLLCCGPLPMQVPSIACFQNGFSVTCDSPKRPSDGPWTRPDGKWLILTTFCEGATAILRGGPDPCFLLVCRQRLSDRSKRASERPT